MTLEDWLKTVPVLPLRAFAADLPNAHDAKRQKCVDFILSDPDARAMAEESMRIEVTSLGRFARTA